MCELLPASWPREPKDLIGVRRAAGITLVAALTLAFGALLVTVAYAQSKYSLKSPGGIAFSDFKGYEDWAVASYKFSADPKSLPDWGNVCHTAVKAILGGVILSMLCVGVVAALIPARPALAVDPMILLREE
jgi:ABC-type antimicrobial peptide transport system permease subunit